MTQPGVAAREVFVLFLTLRFPQHREAAPGGGGGAGSTEGGMGQQRERRSRSAASATTAKNSAGYCRRQQSLWRIFSVIFTTISSAALPGSAVPAPPGHCPQESQAEPPP